MAKKCDPVSAYGYIRVSNVAGQHTDSVRRQLSAIKAHCKANRIKLIKTFEDIGISGTLEHDQRPAFADMMHYIEHNGTKLVICENIDRLSRDLFIQELAIRACQNLGIKIISVAQGDLTDIEDHSRIMVRQIMGSMIQYEKNKLVKRLTQARQRIKDEKGKCSGAKKLSEINPDLLSTLLNLYRRPKKGIRKSYREIARELNNKGYRTSKGNEITVQYVGNVISRHKKGAYKR